MKNSLLQMFLPALVVVLFAGCASQNARWEQTDRENTIEAYERFLLKYPQSEYADEARRRIYDARYQQVQTANSIAAIEDFLREYPEGEHTKKAMAGLESLYYGQARAEKTEQAYRIYLERFPDHPHAGGLRAEWEKQDFDRAQSTGTPEAYEKFLKRHPHGAFAEEARSHLSHQTYFQIDKVLLIPWDNLSGCVTLAERQLRNRLRFELLTTDTGEQGYVLTPVDQDAQSNPAGENATAIARAVQGMIHEGRPDERFYSVLGVGTYVSVDSEDWVEICGIMCKAAAFRIVEKGFEFQPGTIFMENDNSQRAAFDGLK